MPLHYVCDQCGHTAPDAAGWKALEVTLYGLVNLPLPGSRGLEQTLEMLYFHTEDCRTTWAAAHGITVAPAPMGAAAAALMAPPPLPAQAQAAPLPQPLPEPHA